MQIHLDRQHRTILFPNRIRLDTTAPRCSMRPARAVLPTATIAPTPSRSATLSERARAAVYLHGRRMSQPLAPDALGGVDRRVDGRCSAGHRHADGRRHRRCRQRHARVKRARVPWRSHHDREPPHHGRTRRRPARSLSTDAARYAWRLGSAGFASGPLLQITAPSAEASTGSRSRRTAGATTPR